MFIHDIAKTLYVNMGYLPNIPYHLISDKEMFNAFLRDGGFFADYYPCPDDAFQEAYDKLLECIHSKIAAFIEKGEVIPDWVYSYMIMQTITYQSPEVDIAYICDMSNIDSPKLLAEFTPQVAATCYEVSKKWLQKFPSKHRDRPPTMFGEAHVIKSLRLMEANVLLDVDIGVNTD